MSEGFDRWEGDGNWQAAPWFMGENRQLDQWGYSIAVRRRAIAGLARIYTPDVCRAIRDEDIKTAFGPIISLFVPGWPGLVVPLLDLGLNLDVVESISPNDRLGKRLTRRAEFTSAAFEIRIWASLKRGRYPVERIPEGSDATPDFLVEVGAQLYDIEVKLAHQSDADEADADLSERLRFALPHIPRLHLRLEGTAELAARVLDAEERPELRAEFDRIVSAFARVAEEIKRAGGTPGVYDVPPYGAIYAVLEPGHGSISSEVLPDLPARKKAARVARLVRREAMPQLRGERPGIVVVGVFRSADVNLVEDALLGDGTQPVDHRCCRAVVLVDHVKPPNSGPEDGFPVVYPFSTSRLVQLDRAELALATVLGADVRRRAQLIDRAAPGEAGFALDSSRRVVTSVCVGQAAYEPNSTLAFRFDGTPPTVTKRVSGALTPREGDGGP